VNGSVDLAVAAEFGVACESMGAGDLAERGALSRAAGSHNRVGAVIARMRRGFTTSSARDAGPTARCLGATPARADPNGQRGS
jgi:hypothetical protein